MSALYPEALNAFVKKGIELELLNPELANYDLDLLGKAMIPDNDLLFSYLGPSKKKVSHCLESSLYRVNPSHSLLALG